VVDAPAPEYLGDTLPSPFREAGMKKSFVLFLALLFAVAVPLSAQTTLGLNAGVNIATLGGDDVTDASNRTGLNVGVSFLFPVGENVGLYVGGSYSQKGAELSEPPLTLTVGANYIEIPVLLRVGFGGSGSVGAHVYGGGAIGIEASCEIEATDGVTTASADCADADIETKTFDFGLVGGFGLDFGLSESLDLTVDVFYNLGLVSVDDTSTDPGDVKNRAFTIRAGLGIPIG
jgi:hypothetical protein